MADQTVVRTLIIRSKLEGGDQVVDGTKRLASAVENVATVTDAATRRSLSIEQAYRRQTLALDAVARAQEQAARAILVADRALEQGKITQQAYADRLQLITSRFGETTLAAERFAKVNAALANTAQAIDQRLGVRAGSSSPDRAADVAAYGKALDDVRAKFNPLFAAEREYKARMDEINHAFRTGAIPTEREHAAVLEQTKAAYLRQVEVIKGVQLGQQSLANSTKLSRYEMINFGRQVQDIGVSLASGQNPFLVFIQQGTQLTDIALAAGVSMRTMFSQAGAAVMSFLTPTRLVVGGMAGIGAAALLAASNWLDAQKDIERSLIGIGKASGATRESINQIAGGTKGLTIGEARESLLEFVRTGKIYQENLQAANDLTRNFSILTGQSAADAARSLASALADPIKGADELNKQLGFLDGGTKEYIRSLASQGREQEAIRVIIDRMTPAIAKAAETTSVWEVAWRGIKSTVSGVIDVVGKVVSAVTGAGRTIGQQIADAERQRADIQALPSSFFKGGSTAAQVDELTEKIRELQRLQRLDTAAEGEARLRKFSEAADDATKALIPQIGELEKLRELYRDLQRANADPKIGDKQGLGTARGEALQQIELRTRMLQEQRDAQLRITQEVLKTGQAYRGVSLDTALQLRALEGQLGIARAVTGLEKIRAQEEARIDELMLRQGKTMNEAILIASKERAVAEAEINSQAELQLRSLQQQNQLINATSDEERARIQANQTINNLLDQGVDAMRAQQIGAQQLKNAFDQMANAAARAEEAADNARQASRGSALFGGGSGFGGNTSGDAGRAKSSGVLAQLAKFESFVNEQLARGVEIIPAARSGRGGGGSLGSSLREYVSQFQFRETNESIRNTINDILRSGGGLNEAIRGVSDLGSSVPDQLRNDTLLDLLRRLTDQTGSPAQEIAKIKEEIGRAQRLPQSLENMDLIKSLNDRLKELTESTNSLNDTMKIGLDPIYTQGHSALKIGYYDESGGGFHTGTGFQRVSDATRQRLPTSPTMPEQTGPIIVPPGPIGPGPYLNRGPNPNWGQSYDDLSRYHAPITGGVFRFAEGGIMDRYGPYGRVVTGTVAFGGERDGTGIPSVTTKPTLFSTSENYEPEAIIPLGKFLATRGGAGEAARPQEEKPVPPQQNVFVQNNFFPPGSVFGDRRTRRQAAEGFGRASAPGAA